MTRAAPLDFGMDFRPRDVGRAVAVVVRAPGDGVDGGVVRFKVVRRVGGAVVSYSQAVTLVQEILAVERRAVGVGRPRVVGGPRVNLDAVGRGVTL